MGVDRPARLEVTTGYLGSHCSAPTVSRARGNGVESAAMSLGGRRGRSRSFWTFAGAALAATLLLSSCAASSAAGDTASPSSAASSSSATSQATAKAADACDNRPNASGDIYVRMISPGVPAETQQLGGEWRWDVATGKCLTSAQMMIATAPTSAGNCTQVGYVADNPGYDPNATPAKPLTHVAAQAGPAC